MNATGYLVMLVTSGLMLAVPRRWALLPLMIAAFFVPRDQEIEIGPMHFPMIRLLVVLGVLRALARGERIAGRLHFLDWTVIFWALWYLVSSFFHESQALVTRLGNLSNDLGGYFLFRVYLRSPEDVWNLCRMVCVLVLPLAVLMLLEKFMARNLFDLFYLGKAGAYFRHGHVRAYGPFAHPIAAGTIGAACLPMALCLWRQTRKLALVGLIASGIIIVTSTSSGPILTAFAILGGMALWNYRSHTRTIRWLVVCMVVALNFVMNDPVYYLIGRIDLTGSSTGWYRANLIRQAIEHFGEWWLAGTDVTYLWPGTNRVPGTTECDITNYYIRMGVNGGFMLILLFIGMMSAAFVAVGRVVRRSHAVTPPQKFLAWTLGSILFGHAVTFFSLSYFDPAALLLFYCVIGAIGSVYAATVLQSSPEPSGEASEVTGPTPATTGHA